MKHLKNHYNVLEKPKRIIKRIPITKRFFKNIKMDYGEIPVTKEIYHELICFLEKHFNDTYYIQKVIEGNYGAFEPKDSPRYTAKVKREYDLDQAFFFYRNITKEFIDDIVFDTEDVTNDILINSEEDDLFESYLSPLQMFCEKNKIENLSPKTMFYLQFSLPLIGQKNMLGSSIHAIIHPYIQEDDDSFYTTNLNFIFINDDGELADISNPIQDFQSAYHPVDSFVKLGKLNDEIIFTYSPVLAMHLYSKYGHDTAIWFSYKYNTFDTIPEGIKMVTIASDNEKDHENAKEIVDSHEGAREYVRRVLIEKPYN